MIVPRYVLWRWDRLQFWNEVWADREAFCGAVEAAMIRWYGTGWEDG